VWERHPLSLRVKDFFETLETFSLITKQIYWSCTSGPEASARFRTIFDMCCGHGLLGVLLSYRFPRIRVVCVDRKRREGFDHFVAAFQACLGNEVGNATGGAESGGAKDRVGVLRNLSFVESDIADVSVPPSSFVVCVHACNEANQIALDKAVAAKAAFAAMPCCIRSRIYSVHAFNLQDDTRYAVMVGTMAREYNAHTVTGINRGITNRHLLMFGGYTRAHRDPSPQEDPGHGAHS
jgi:hypothetical protein